MIRPRGTKFQVDVSLNGERIQRQANTEAEAIQLEKQLLEDLELRATLKDRKQWTLGEAFERTFDRFWRGSKSEMTVVKVSKQVLTHFGKGTLLDDIASDHIDLWVSSLKRAGNSNGTINRKLACLSKMMSHAVSRGAMKAKPAMEKAEEGLGRIRFITEEEESQILNLLTLWDKLDHRDAVVVLVDTGMRTGELFRMSAQDLNGNMMSIWENKASLPRSVPMTARVQAILSLRAKRYLSGPLFPGDQRWLRTQWERVKAKMGLGNDDQFVPHCLRHTCASRLAQRGFPIQKIQRWMGHKTITVTLRYAHLCPADLAAGVDLLERKPVIIPFREQQVS